MTSNASHAPQVRSPAVHDLPPPASRRLADGGRRTLLTVVLPLLGLALGAWVVTARGEEMVMGAATFPLAWLIMMVAMMLPAVAPVVALYAPARPLDPRRPTLVPGRR